MSHTPIDGPLGLEGRHQFKSGDQFPPSTEASVFMYGKNQHGSNWWIKIDRITGLHGLGDGDDFRDSAEGRVGEIVYPGAQRGKTIVYEGRIIGMTLPYLRQGANELRRVAAETRERREGSITIVDPANTGEGYANIVRCISLEMDDEQQFGPNRVPSPWQRKFTLGVRAHDPRFVWYPVASQLENGEGENIVISNDGLAHADLIFDVFSDSALGMHVTLENVTTGKLLEFGTATTGTAPIPADDLLHVNWTQRAAVWVEAANYPAYIPNVDMMPYLDKDTSDWWDAMEWGLGPGDNEITVSGVGVGTWDVYWQHTSY